MFFWESCWGFHILSSKNLCEETCSKKVDAVRLKLRQRTEAEQKNMFCCITWCCLIFYGYLVVFCFYVGFNSLCFCFEFVLLSRCGPTKIGF